MTSDYLLGLSNIENHPNADLNDLHLSDEIIELWVGEGKRRRMDEIPFSAYFHVFQSGLTDAAIIIFGITVLRIPA